MTAKKPSTTAKATTQKTAAEIKADEVAAMMGDVETSAPAKPTAPPAVKTANKPESEAEDQEPEETEDQTETVDQTDADDDLDTDEDESDDEQAEFQRAKVGHMVILSKTVHTKDADGKDVQFIASKKPQDLGEYAAMAIAAGCAKPHKAG